MLVRKNSSDKNGIASQNIIVIFKCDLDLSISLFNKIQGTINKFIWRGKGSPVCSQSGAAGRKWRACSTENIEILSCGSASGLFGLVETPT